MRCGIILAAALTALPVFAMTTTGARADDEWCGYMAKDNAVVECGYTTSAHCEDAVGKGGMCFVDPDYAANAKRTTPAIDIPSRSRLSQPARS
jgi:hypothetical protein